MLRRHHNSNRTRQRKGIVTQTRLSGTLFIPRCARRQDSAFDASTFGQHFASLPSTIYIIGLKRSSPNLDGCHTTPTLTLSRPWYRSVLTPIESKTLWLRHATMREEMFAKATGKEISAPLAFVLGSSGMLSSPYVDGGWREKTNELSKPIFPSLNSPWDDFAFTAMQHGFVNPFADRPA